MHNNEEVRVTEPSANWHMQKESEMSDALVLVGRRKRIKFVAEVEGTTKTTTIYLDIKQRYLQMRNYC